MSGDPSGPDRRESPNQRHERLTAQAFTDMLIATVLSQTANEQRMAGYESAAFYAQRRADEYAARSDALQDRADAIAESEEA